MVRPLAPYIITDARHFSTRSHNELRGVFIEFP